jgi:hypothetical protein
LDTKEVAKVFSEFALKKVSEVKTTVEREERLKLTVIAWNIAYWEEKEKREEYIVQVQEQFYKDCENENQADDKVKLLRKYIDEKRTKYQFPKNQILDSKLEELSESKLLFHLDISEHDGAYFIKA